METPVPVNKYIQQWQATSVHPIQTLCTTHTVLDNLQYITQNDSLNVRKINNKKK